MNTKNEPRYVVEYDVSLNNMLHMMEQDIGKKQGRELYRGGDGISVKEMAEKFTRALLLPAKGREKAKIKLNNNGFSVYVPFYGEGTRKEALKFAEEIKTRQNESTNEKTEITEKVHELTT